VDGKVSFPGLEAVLREIVREEIARAPEIGGAGGYLSTKGAATYLDLTKGAIDSMVKRGVLVPVRRSPRLFTREELDRWVYERGQE
jgi:Helix-turn-helix domain